MNAPLVVRTRAELAAALAGRPGPRAAVLTMGALHDGHLAHVRQVRDLAETVVVSVFVNPLQFGADEDLDRYPRDLDGDVAAMARAGVDVVFAPGVREIYPDGEPLVHVSAGSMGETLEGASRPGHFDGVLTVVLKLLNLIGPDVATFGLKDAQQFAVVRRMVRDLDLPVQIVPVETVREPDGLAMSSRNAYLTDQQRQHASVLWRALRAGLDAAHLGADQVRARAAAVLDGQGDAVVVDYLALVEPDGFTEVPTGYTGPAVLAVAARVGKTRLIDNVPLEIEEMA